MSSGYSGTPLARKLSLRDGQRVWFHAMPESIADEIDEYALELTFVADPAEGIDAAHVFVTERARLERLLTSLRHQIASDGQVWVSCPNKLPKSTPTSPRTQSAKLPCRLASSTPRFARWTRPGRASSW